MFLEVEVGGQDPDEEAVKVYLIRFIADLPLSWYTGSVIVHNPPIELPHNDIHDPPIELPHITLFITLLF